MTFMPHPELPGFPTQTFDVIRKEHYYFPNCSGQSTRDCVLTLQFRTVPGQTNESVERDLQRLVATIKELQPAFNCTIEVPAPGTENGWNQEPMECPPDEPLVLALAEGQSL